jgi:hypothetical protein
MIKDRLISKYNRLKKVIARKNKRFMKDSSKKIIKKKAFRNKRMKKYV